MPHPNPQTPSPQQEASIHYDPNLHHRRSIRLKDYDYSQPGAYFITLATWKRKCLFGEIVDGVMKINDIGFVAQTEWEKLPFRFPGLTLENFVVMPDHMHGIILLDLIEGKSRLLGTIISSYKSTVSRLINGLCHTPGTPVWQRNYYEHIIRNERDFIKIQTYIEENPNSWGDNLMHSNYPSNIP